ncbi:MAG: hypothetical protein BGO43_15380 [Gammaproteobacteria bacterium 39-13]|nr:alpha/beta fold hydrolase [Gammaproteobacteria bacterium]OJV87797.1 MAG: hypothetical protein BGO43_15380 [Gammaproteobacteria bacterium 39-13]
MDNNLPKRTHTVILLHGIARTSRSMKKLERTLFGAGFDVLNIDYPSRKYNIATLATHIYKQIDTYQQNVTTLHFVTHSMGGLIVRELLSHYPLPNVGRIVMVAPPNHGSEVADFLKNNILFKLFYGPAGQELITAASHADIPTAIHYELGIIAGNKGFDPVCHFLLPKPHDGKVTVESTKYRLMKDHIILPAEHSFIMNYQQVIHQVKYFLQEGKFLHPKKKK